MIDLRTALYLLLTAVALPALALPAQTDASASVAAGYHVIYSYSGSTPPGNLTTLIKAGKVGGVLLFGENVSPSLPDQVKDWQATYKSSSAYAGTPLLIMTDQEGGQVRRLSGGPQKSEKQVGSSADPAAAATTAGQQAASALQAYGNNANLAPVGGVYRQPGDFLDRYGRSYSNDSAVTSTCISAFVKAQQASGGPLATAKHFPGLGAAATNDNTDAQPVTINLSLNTLRSVDEAPFKAAITAGVDMVMPSWALYPALDGNFPSGLSRKWVTEELRNRLGFKGVVVTDAIEAGGLNAFGSDPGHRAVLAMQAGQDLILAGARNVDQGVQIVNALAAASSDGTLDADEFAQSSARILVLRKKL